LPIKEANRQRIMDAGGTIRQLTPEQRKVWVETMKPVWDKFEGDIGTGSDRRRTVCPTTQADYRLQLSRRARPAGPFSQSPEQ
jgi:hypothetical protein